MYPDGTAVQTVRDGGDPPGLEASYYSVRVVEGEVPAGVRLAGGLAGEMHAGGPEAR